MEDWFTKRDVFVPAAELRQAGDFATMAFRGIKASDILGVDVVRATQKAHVR